MPKMKSNSGSRKRFRSTGSGKIKRNRAFASHILTKKSRGRKRRLGQSTLLDSTNERNIRHLLPYGAR